MRILFGAAFAICTGLASTALCEPGYFRVVDVADNDTLNIRALPSANSEDVGDLPFDKGRIEVIEVDESGKWGKIVWQDGNGWIAMRFLEPDQLQMLPGTGLPAGLVCVGTEPFWNISLSAETASYSDITGNSHPFTLSGARVAEGQARFPVQVDFAGQAAAVSMLLRANQCSDGMSDRAYPWQVDMFLNAADGNRFLTGCCQLPLDIEF